MHKPESQDSGFYFYLMCIYKCSYICQACTIIKSSYPPIGRVVMKQPTLMIRMTRADIKAAIEFAEQKGFKFKSKDIRYLENGEIVHTYKATLAAFRYAAKKKFVLPDNQIRPKGYKIGITLIYPSDNDPISSSLANA